jgi:hypothetical protein
MSLARGEGPNPSVHPETAKQHLDRAIQLYVSSERRVLAMRLGQDVGTLVLAWRSLAQRILGYPDSARADVEQALENATAPGGADRSGRLHRPLG